MKAELIEYPMFIKGKLYDLKNGIPLAKTLYGDDFDKLPEGLKDDVVKKNWKKYKGIEQNLYLMSLSEDYETIDVCLQVLKSKNIPFKYSTVTDYNNDQRIERVRKIWLFVDKKTPEYYLKDSKGLWNNLD